MSHIVYLVALGIALVSTGALVAALIQCDKRRMNAEREIARRDARERIHKWGPGNAGQGASHD
jgi:hypothetical protein